MVLHGMGFLVLRGLGPRSTAIGHYERIYRAEEGVWVAGISLKSQRFILARIALIRMLYGSYFGNPKNPNPLNPKP